MSKSIFKQFMEINETLVKTLHTGFHIWNDDKWLMNGCSFVRIQNRRLNIPKSNHKYIVNFDDFTHNDINPLDEINDQKDILKYNPDAGVTNLYYHENKYIKYDNRLLNLICKINGNTEFFVIVRDYALYLYTYCRTECDYVFQGFILCISEGGKPIE